MKILLVNKFAHVTGGADQHVLDITEELRRRGHEVALLSTKSELNSESSDYFVRATVTSNTKRSVSSRAQFDVLWRSIYNLDVARATKLLMSVFQPDIVHCHKLYPQLSVAPVVVATRSGVPVVQTVHDFEFVSASPYDPTGSPIDRMDTRPSFRALNTIGYGVRRFVHRPRVAAWIAPSSAIARLHARSGVQPEVIHNFAGRTSSVGGRWHERDGIVFVGRLAPEKGVEDVLEVARSLHAHRVTVAGWGPKEGAVRDASRSLPNVTFVGRLERDDAIRLVASSRVVLMPSAWEAGPLTALEAMSVGTPIVCYPAGGLGEYVSVGGAGVVVQNVRELERACAALMDDQPRWRNLSAAGLAASKTTFSADVCLGALEDLYRSVCRTAGRAVLR